MRAVILVIAIIFTGYFFIKSPSHENPKGEANSGSSVNAPNENSIDSPSELSDRYNDEVESGENNQTADSNTDADQFENKNGEQNIAKSPSELAQQAAADAQNMDEIFQAIQWLKQAEQNVENLKKIEEFQKEAINRDPENPQLWTDYYKEQIDIARNFDKTVEKELAMQIRKQLREGRDSPIKKIRNLTAEASWEWDLARDKHGRIRRRAGSAPNKVRGSYYRAWSLYENGRQSAALRVLKKARKRHKNNKRLNESLNALENGQQTPFHSYLR